MIYSRLILGNAGNDAYSLGLGSHPMTAFRSDEFARILGLPSTIVPTALVSVGYPADSFAGKMRYPLEDILISTSSGARHDPLSHRSPPAIPVLD